MQKALLILLSLAAIQPSFAEGWRARSNHIVVGDLVAANQREAIIQKAEESSLVAVDLAELIEDDQQIILDAIAEHNQALNDIRSRVPERGHARLRHVTLDGTVTTVSLDIPARPAGDFILGKMGSINARTGWDLGRTLRRDFDALILEYRAIAQQHISPSVTEQALRTVAWLTFLEPLVNEMVALTESPINIESATKKFLVRDTARIEARADQIGERPTDGFFVPYHSVDDYLKRALRDPDSLEYVDHTAPHVVEISPGQYVWEIWTSYRARNGFGGMTFESASFHVRHNKVINVIKDK